MRTILHVPPLQPEPPPGGGLPEKFPERELFLSRVPEQSQTYGDIVVATRKPLPEVVSMYGGDPGLVELIADVPVSGDSDAAIEKLAPVFAALIDLLAFDMATTIHVGQMNVMDVTPPVAVGDQRERVIWTSPRFDRSRSTDMGTIQGRLLAELPESAHAGDSKTASILRWFVKSLSTDLLVDQFMFLWIALETLLDSSDIRVEEPYKGRCQHLIEHCPECGETTTKMVRGSTLKTYLQKWGVTAKQAKDLWDVRQLMHGAIPFDSKKLENLASLVQPLRAVVAAGLKDALGKPADNPPLVAMAGLSMHPAVGLRGTIKVTEDHISPLTPPESPTPENGEQG